MYTKLIVLGLVVCGGLVLAPSATLAYFTTDQSAIQLNENTMLYTVTYRFGMENNGLAMPAGAVRLTDSASTTSPYVGYEVMVDDTLMPTLGQSAAFVFSSSPIADAEYVVAEGTDAVFVLAVLLTITPEEIATLGNDPDLSIQVTSLPFTIVSDDGERANRLNPSELQYYRTPAIDF